MKLEFFKNEIFFEIINILQGMHLVNPFVLFPAEASWYVPSGHKWHSVSPNLLENLDRPQINGVSIPGFGQYLPNS